MIPDYGDVYDADTLFSPGESVAAHGDGLPDLPPAVILGFQDSLHETVREAGDRLDTDQSREFDYYILSESVGFVPVHEVGIGAPVAATVTEKVIAAGAEVVIMLGGCASLQTEFAPEAVLLPTHAVRDEGASYHYVPPNETVEATPELVDELDDAFSVANFDTHRGPTWTTSAVFRETIPQIEHYRDEGFVSLCMETAAIWAVCQYRGIDTATVHQIGDYLSPDEWIPESEGERGLPEMLEPTVKALKAHVNGD